MALMQCPECKYGVSEHAAWCQRCGYPISKTHPLNIDNSKIMQAVAEALSKPQDMSTSKGTSASAYSFDNPPSIQPLLSIDMSTKPQEPGTPATANTSSFDFDSKSTKPTIVPNKQATSEQPTPAVSSGAMVKCPECGHDVSKKAASCAYCGCPMEAITQYGNQPPNRQAVSSGADGGWLIDSGSPTSSNAKGGASGLSMLKSVPRKALIIPLIIVGVLALGFFAYNYFGLDFFGGSPDTNQLSDTTEDEGASTRETTPIPVPETTPIPAPEPLNIPDGGMLWFDRDDIVITVTRINRDREGYVSDISISVANNGTSDTGVGVLGKGMITTAVRINNQYSVGTGFGVDVAAGKIANTEIDIGSDDSRLFDIKDVHEITADIITYSIGDFIATNVVEYGTHSLVISQDNNDSGIINGVLVFSNEHIDVYACDFETTWLGRTVAVFVVRNKTGIDFKFELDKLSVNRIMDNDRDSGNIYNDTYRVFRLMLSDDYNEDSIQEIEFTVQTSPFADLISLNGNTVGVVTANYQDGSAVPVN